MWWWGVRFVEKVANPPGELDQSKNGWVEWQFGWKVGVG